MIKIQKEQNVTKDDFMENSTSEINKVNIDKEVYQSDIN